MSSGRGVDVKSEQSLVFRAGSLLCALGLDQIIETMRPLAVQPLAGTPAFVQGLCVMRGVPTPVVHVARLVGGGDAPVSRFVAVKTGRTPMAFATGPVLGIRHVTPDDSTDAPAGPRNVSVPVVTGVGAIDTEPLVFLDGAAVLPDEVWSAVPVRREQP